MEAKPCILRQNRTVQIIRGISIIAVVFIHNTPSGLAQVFIRPFLNFSVATFLFLSGFLTHIEKYNFKRRIKKVIITYVIWTVVYVILSHYNNPMRIFKMIIRCLFTSESAAMMYFILVYCELCFLVPIIDKLAKSKYRYVGFIISPLEIIIMRMIPTFCKIQFNGYINILVRNSFLGWFGFFYLGYLLGNGLIYIRRNRQQLYILLVASIILQIAEGYLYYTFDQSKCGTQLKLSCLLTNTIFCIILYSYISNRKEYNCKGLFYIGNLSFGIYYSHMAIMQVLNHIPYYSKVVVFPLNAVITIMISLLFVRVVTRIMKKNSFILGI